MICSYRIVHARSHKELFDDLFIDTTMLASDLSGLLSELKKREVRVTDEAISKVFTTGGELFLAMDRCRFVGMVALYLQHHPGELRATVHNVIVHPRYEKQGIGRRLLEHLHERALEAGALKIDLTSGPGRTGARHLYEKLGYRVRNTAAYRLELLGKGGEA